MSTEQFIAYQWYLAGAFLAFIFAICTLFFQALFHEKRIALAWLLVIFVISLLNGSGVVSMELLGAHTPDENPVVRGISGIGDYLVLGLGIVELLLFAYFVIRHFKKIYVSVPAIVIVLCVGFAYQAYQDLMGSGNLMFRSEVEQIQLEQQYEASSSAVSEEEPASEVSAEEQ